MTGHADQSYNNATVFLHREAGWMGACKTNKLEAVLTQALALSPSQRAQLARSLISSIEGPPEEGAEAAWLDLARKRLAELDSGEIEPVTWDSIKQRIRAS